VRYPADGSQGYFDPVFHPVWVLICRWWAKERESGVSRWSDELDLEAHLYSPAAFRIPWGIQMLPAFILFVGLFFFPRSPRWLASKDRWDEA
jgi:hypothetical protein